MKYRVILLSAFLAFSGTFAHAQGGPSGRGSISGDPAASSATPSASPNAGATTGSSSRANPSGSGTSSSGGTDANGDGGRDKMPETNRSLSQSRDQREPGKMP
jgi:hypothetical protein